MENWAKSPPCSKHLLHFHVLCMAGKEVKHRWEGGRDGRVITWVYK